MKTDNLFENISHSFKETTITKIGETLDKKSDLDLTQMIQEIRKAAYAAMLKTSDRKQFDANLKKELKALFENQEIPEELRKNEVGQQDKYLDHVFKHKPDKKVSFNVRAESNFSIPRQVAIYSTRIALLPISALITKVTQGLTVKGHATITEGKETSNLYNISRQEEKKIRNEEIQKLQEQNGQNTKHTIAGFEVDIKNGDKKKIEKIFRKQYKKTYDSYIEVVLKNYNDFSAFSQAFAELKQKIKDGQINEDTYQKHKETIDKVLACDTKDFRDAMQQWEEVSKFINIALSSAKQVYNEQINKEFKLSNQQKEDINVEIQKKRDERNEKTRDEKAGIKTVTFEKSTVFPFIKKDTGKYRIHRTNTKPAEGTIVYFHGQSGSLYDKETSAQTLNAKFPGYNVIIMEYPGYLNTRGSKNSKNIADRNNEMFEEMRQDSDNADVNFDNVTVVNLSVGTGPGTQFAADHPKETKGLMLVAGYSNTAHFTYKQFLGFFGKPQKSIKGIVRTLHWDVLKPPVDIMSPDIPMVIVHNKDDELFSPEKNAKKNLEGASGLRVYRFNPDSTGGHGVADEQFSDGLLQLRNIQKSIQSSVAQQLHSVFVPLKNKMEMEKSNEVVNFITRRDKVPNNEENKVKETNIKDNGLDIEIMDLNVQGEVKVQVVQKGLFDNSLVEGKYAIVNAANCSLIGTGGIAKIIQKNGGSDLVEALKEKGKSGCKVTENVVTEPYGIQKNNENITHIIHAVGPDLREYNKGFTSKEYAKKYKEIDFKHDKGSLKDIAQKALTQTYLHIFKTALKQGIQTIVCPVISGGIFMGKKFTEDNIAYMTIHAIHNAQEILQKEGKLRNNLNIVLCAPGKEKEGYFQLLNKYNEHDLQSKFVDIQLKERKSEVVDEKIKHKETHVRKSGKISIKDNEIFIEENSDIKKQEDIKNIDLRKKLLNQAEKHLEDIENILRKNNDNQDVTVLVRRLGKNIVTATGRGILSAEPGDNLIRLVQLNEEALTKLQALESNDHKESPANPYINAIKTTLAEIGSRNNMTKNNKLWLFKKIEHNVKRAIKELEKAGDTVSKRFRLLNDMRLASEELTSGRPSRLSQYGLLRKIGKSASEFDKPEREDTEKKRSRLLNEVKGTIATGEKLAHKSRLNVYNGKLSPEVQGILDIKESASIDKNFIKSLEGQRNNEEAALTAALSTGGKSLKNEKFLQECRTFYDLSKQLKEVWKKGAEKEEYPLYTETLTYSREAAKQLLAIVNGTIDTKQGLAEARKYMKKTKELLGHKRGPAEEKILETHGLPSKGSQRMRKFAGEKETDTPYVSKASTLYMNLFANDALRTEWRGDAFSIHETAQWLSKQSQAVKDKASEWLTPQQESQGEQDFNKWKNSVSTIMKNLTSLDWHFSNLRAQLRADRKDTAPLTNKQKEDAKMSSEALLEPAFKLWLLQYPKKSPLVRLYVASQFTKEEIGGLIKDETEKQRMIDAREYFETGRQATVKLNKDGYPIKEESKEKVVRTPSGLQWQQEHGLLIPSDKECNNFFKNVVEKIKPRLEDRKSFVARLEEEIKNPIREK